MSNDCIFCKIINGDIPSSKVYEDDKFYVFMDIYPIVRGHTLVIPKHHCRNILDTPEEIGADFYPLLTKISNAVKKAYNADGIMVMQFNEPAAGQEVYHSHVHILPRYEHDNKNIGIPQRLKVNIDDINEDCIKIKNSL